MVANKMGRKKNIRVADCSLHTLDRTVEGRYVLLDGERFYRIAHYDQLAPFFMSVVSDSDHWMFISSNGALTAGRRNPEHALFPCETDDKIHDAWDRTGSKTILRLNKTDGDRLWEPFSARYQNLYETERHLYKNIPGNKLIFEEINRSLGLSFQYAWLVSERFGFVRHAKLANLSTEVIQLSVVDGLQNLLPANIDRGMQNAFSTLLDAYKKSGLIAGNGIGIYALSSIPVDRAEPSESLMANTVWSTGISEPKYLLSDRQLDAFRHGRAVSSEQLIRGQRGSYFLQSGCELVPNQQTA
ncbi:MAG: hypothetical protein P8N76_17025 [Pirellulaceae bacterium]|nr:hypothetical protein [Pirellulaceae bacterium]